MTNIETAIVADSHESGVDWPAIFLGTFIAVALSSLMLTFGAAIGLSFTNLQSAKTTSIPWMAIAAALWLMWVEVMSVALGGYMAGRMRGRSTEIAAHERELHDGAHGLGVWAVGVVAATLLTGYLASSGASAVTKAAGDTAYWADRLLATDKPLAAGVTLNTGAIQRVLGKIGTGSALDDGDKTYLAQSISAQTGLSPDEAKQRVTATIDTISAQANTARRYGIILAFFTAASLLVGAVAAWWAGAMGGKHRFEAEDHSHLTRWH